MKKILIITLLLVCSVGLLPFVNAVTLYPYPTTIIHFTTFNTYLMWTQTIICDNLIVNETHATFSNVSMGSDSLLSSLVFSVLIGNATLTQLFLNNITYITLSGLNENSTTQLTFPQKPLGVRLDNVEMSEDNSWSWNASTSILTLWVDLIGTHTSSQFRLQTAIETPIVPPWYPPITPNTNQTQNATSVTFLITNSTLHLQNYIVFIENFANSTDTYSKLTDQYGYAVFNISRGSYIFQVIYQTVKIYEGKFNLTDTNLFIPVDLSNLNPQPIIENWVITHIAILIIVIVAAVSAFILLTARRQK